MDEGACTEAADRCEWWCGSKCVYSFETERLGHCGEQDGRSEALGIECQLHSTPLWEISSEYFIFSDSCNDACPAKFVPVCGTDKITYANECLLKMVACR